MDGDNVHLDVLIVAGNARSLIANRGDLIAEMRGASYSVGALVPKADYLHGVDRLGIRIFPYDLARTGVNPIADLRSFRQITRTIRANRPAIVFSYNIKPVIYGSIAARLVGGNRRYALITGLGHTYITSSKRNIRLRRLTDWMYSAAIASCDKVLFQNPDDLAEFRQRGILKDACKAVLINGSGINLDRFAMQPIPEGRPNFLFVGRLLREKGIGEFVEAAALLHRKWPHARFTVVGGHDANLPHAVDAGELERWKESAIVEFVGSVDDVRPWLRQASVLVLPSYREGTPKAVLEAMSVGRPIITTETPGCRETVREGVNGFLVPVGDAEHLADAMARFLESPMLIPQMGDASRRIAESKYDVSDVNRTILSSLGLIRVEPTRGRDNP